MTARQITDTPIVFIVDDNEDVRETIKSLFESVNQTVEAFASARAFLDAYPVGQTGCLIADVRMPEMSGLELHEELRRREINLPVIIITGFGDVEMAVNAMKAGAADFIAKPYKEQELLDRVQKAIGRSLEAREAVGREQEVRERRARLTPREREVLDLVVAGEPNKRIAHHLALSEKTVEFHRANIMKKLDARSVAELVKKTLGGRAT
ncbi:MAG: response regulator transcription factor [Rhodospirillales bacterium]|nr:response regulator transcription factor [Rhodospirillales bacterium]